MSRNRMNVPLIRPKATGSKTNFSAIFVWIHVYTILINVLITEFARSNEVYTFKRDENEYKWNCSELHCQGFLSNYKFFEWLFNYYFFISFFVPLKALCIVENVDRRLKKLETVFFCVVYYAIQFIRTYIYIRYSILTSFE